MRQICSRIVWRNQSALWCFAAIGLIVLWPLTMIGLIPLHLRRYGGDVKRASGKGRLRQCLEQISLILRHRLSPKHYYRFRLYLPELRQRAGEFLLRNQVEGIVYPCIQQPEAARHQPLTDKLKFADLCAASNLPHVPTLIAFKAGRALPGAQTPETAFDNTDLFVKPVRGSRGARSECWRGLGAGLYRSSRGQELDKPALFAHIAALSARQPFLVQPALRNHRDFLDLTSGALSTMRVISWRNEAGEFEVTDAILRMPVDPTAPVDNFHAGGIAAPIDIGTGTLGRATDLGSGSDVVWFDRHPFTGARITGRGVPRWHDTLQLALRAHQAFDKHTVVGWDIAVLDDGPCIIEGNISPGVGTLQRAANAPLGSRRFGQLIVHHLMNGTSPASKNGFVE